MTLRAMVPQRRTAPGGQTTASRFAPVARLDDARRPVPNGGLAGHRPPGQVTRAFFPAHRLGAISVHRLASPRLQAKLVLGQPGDRYEQEADAVAERIVSASAPSSAPPRAPSAQPASAQTIRRQTTGETEEEPYRETPEPIGLSAALTEEEDEQAIQAKPAPGASPTLAPGAERAISAARASGQPLPLPTQQLMEERFGASFSGVRVHHHADAARLAASIHARAFTVGRDIFFGRGEYQPHSREGQRLLAHELTHVVQQGGASGPTLSLSSPVIQRTLSEAFTNYRGRCECGEALGNNCAHYLSDSLIRSGYADDLDGGTGGLYRRRKGRIVCKAGRPVRAKELAAWFAEQATETQSGEPDDNGYWAVYQERHSDGQGHVLIHSHTGSTYTYRGTGDYPSWRTQDHYQF